MQENKMKRTFATTSKKSVFALLVLLALCAGLFGLDEVETVYVDGNPIRVFFRDSRDEMYERGNLLIWFHPNVTNEQISEFTKKFAEYELTQLGKHQYTEGRLDIRIFHYNEDLLRLRHMIFNLSREDVVYVVMTNDRYAGISRRSAEPVRNWEHGKILIGFHEYVTDKMVNEFVARFAHYELREENFVSRSLNLRAFTFNENIFDMDYMEEMFNNEDMVRGAYRNAWIPRNSLQAPPDPYFEFQWALRNTGQSGGKVGEDIDVLRAWNLLSNQAGPTMVLAIIDGGWHNYIDQMDSRWINTDEMAPTFITFNNVLRWLPFNMIDNDGNGFVNDYWGWNATLNNGLFFAGSRNMSRDTHGVEMANISSAMSNAMELSGITKNFPDLKYFPIDVTLFNPDPNIVPVNSRSAIIRALRYVRDVRIKV